MLAFHKERPLPADADGGLARQADSRPSPPRRWDRTAAGVAGRLISCEIDNNMARAQGPAWCYYRSNREGRQMLILECRPGDRIQINSTTEIVILDINRDQVEMAIDSLPDDAT